LYSSVHYPGDYGFIPQTLWEDGDALDILILTNRPLYPMTLAEVRVIGVMRMVDNEESDDKIIAVYDTDPRFKEYKSISEIPAHLLKELRHFFETYKQLQGRMCEVPQILDKEHAYEAIHKAKQLYAKKFKNRESLIEYTSISEGTII
jgi:inorganic pyrophosphatase